MMIAEFGALVVAILDFIASYDLTVFAFCLCLIAFAFALVYNLSGAEKL